MEAAGLELDGAAVGLAGGAGTALGVEGSAGDCTGGDGEGPVDPQAAATTPTTRIATRARREREARPASIGRGMPGIVAPAPGGSGFFIVCRLGDSPRMDTL